MKDHTDWKFDVLVEPPSSQSSERRGVGGGTLTFRFAPTGSYTYSSSTA